MKLKAALMIFTVAALTKTLMDPITIKVSGEATVPLDRAAFANGSLAGKELAHGSGELGESSPLAWRQVCGRCKVRQGTTHRAPLLHSVCGKTSVSKPKICSLGEEKHSIREEL